MLTWLRSLADTILGRTGKTDRLDTATRMAMDADFSDRAERVERACQEPAPHVDQLEELERFLKNRSS